MKKSILVLFLTVIIPTGSHTEIINGSFEVNGYPSLEGWETMSAASYQDAPQGGGLWCLRLTGGCVHGVCWQADQNVRNGQVWRVSCWMRRAIETPHGWGTLGWYIITQDGWQNGNVIEYDSANWTFLSVVDTFLLAEGDTVGVFMDGGGCFGGPGTVYFDLVETEMIGTVVEEEVIDGPVSMPQIQLYRNHPNPFAYGTFVKYALSQNSEVHIVIYNLLGQKIRTLVHGEQEEGLHTVIWHATDNSGRKVPSGTYFLRLEAEEHTLTRKVCVMR